MIKSFIFSKKGAFLAFALTAVLFLLRPFFIESQWIAFDFHEHFYNTLHAIDVFKNTGRIETTDFSPVYAFLLYVLTFLFSTSSVWFFFAVRFLIILSGALSLLLLNALIKRIPFETTGKERFLANALFFMLFFKDACAATGSFLVIPVLLAGALMIDKALKKPSVLSGLALGLTLSFSLFIQWDAVGFLLTLALVFYFQFNGKTPVSYKEFLKIFIGFVLGLLPAGLYFWYQKDALPSTYLLWQSVQDRQPHLFLLLYLWYPIRYFINDSLQLVLMTMPFALCLLTAFVSFPKENKNLTGADTVFFTLVWYPIIWAVVLGITTYVNLPVYAFYSLAIGTPFSALFVVKKIRDNQKDLTKEKVLLGHYCVTMACICFLISVLQISTPTTRVYQPIVQATINAYEKTPGIYAMGRGAGIVSYFKKDMPLIRIDGYGADSELSREIKQSRSLSDVLTRLKADFYIALNLDAENGCAIAREPSETLFGANNRAMDSWICEKPLIKEKLTNGIVFSVHKASDLHTQNHLVKQP